MSTLALRLPSRLVRWLAGAALVAAPLAVAAQPAPAEDVIELDITTLTGIEWEPGEDLPKSVTKYDGKKVVIAGYMHSSTKRGTSTFLLVGDSCQCSGDPLVQHFVKIDLGDGVTDPRPGEIEVEGELSVSVEEEDGFVTSIYRLKGDFL